MFVVRFPGQSGRIAMRPVARKRPTDFNGSVQVNYVMVSNTGKPAFLVHLVNVGSAKILPGPGRRTMNNDRVNIIGFHLRRPVVVRVIRSVHILVRVVRPNRVPQSLYVRASV